MNFLRTASTRRLIAGAALATVIVVGGVAAAMASGSGGTPPPPEALDVAIHNALTTPTPAGVSARVHFTNNLISSGALSTGSPLLTGASGRLWVSGGSARLELQSDAGDAQVVIANGHLTVYDASSNTAYEADLGTAKPVANAPAHTPPSVSQISTALAHLEQEATLSGADPTTQAGQGAYRVSVTPKHDAGLLGEGQLAWDAATGVPLRVAVTAAGSSSPVLALSVTDISYGSVDPSVFAVTPPAGAKIVDLGSLSQKQGSGSGGEGTPTTGLPAVQAAVPFTVAAPDTLVGLPRAGVRLVHVEKAPAALVTYGKGLGAIAVLERAAQAKQAGDSPMGGLPSVTIDGATGQELPTALGTLISVQRGGVSYTLVGSLPANAAEAALRAVLA